MSACPDRIVSRTVPIQTRPAMYATLARLETARGRNDHARLAMDRMSDALDDIGPGIYRPMAQIWRARWLRDAGHASEADRLLVDLAAECGDLMDYWACAAREARVQSPRQKRTTSIYALGVFRLVVDGREVALPRGDGTRLLKVLLALQGRASSTDVVVDWLWPEGRGRNAESPQTIKQSCHLLRREMRVRAGLPASFLCRSDRGWHLDSDLIWNDVGEFEHAAREAVRRNAAGDVEQALVHARRAADLYRGPFLGTDELNAKMLGRRVELEDMNRRVTDILANIPFHREELVGPESNAAFAVAGARGGRVIQYP